MSISEIIGLIIMLLVLGLSVVRRSYELPEENEGSKRRSKGAQRQQDDLLRQLLASMDLEDEIGPPAREKRPTRPPPVPRQPPPLPPKRDRYVETVREKVVGDYDFHGSIEDRHQTSAIESRHVDSAIDGRSANDFVNQRIQATGQDAAYRRRGKRKRTSKAQHLVRGVKLKDAIILNEILGKPVSLRDL